jgi:hypothetical protein
MQLQGQDVVVAVAPTIGLVKIFRGRLAEVEERLDFAERLLDRAREADQLPGGAHR